MRNKCEVFKAKDFTHLNGSQEEYLFRDIADHANAILAERGVVVRCDLDYYKRNNSGSIWSEDKEDKDTHTALLINIQPIEQESEERKLLRELTEWKEWDGMTVCEVKGKKPTLYDIQDRARRLLEK